MAVSDREAASDEKVGDKSLIQEELYIPFFRHAPIFFHEATKTVGAVMRSWSCHWSPHAVERLIL